MLDLEWKDGKLIHTKIVSKLGNPTKLVYGNRTMDLRLEKRAVKNISAF